MYQVVSKEVLEQAEDTKKSSNINIANQLLERLRNALGIQNCIKMLFFGAIPGFNKGSSRFLGQLRRENQSVKS